MDTLNNETPPVKWTRSLGSEHLYVLEVPHNAEKLVTFVIHSDRVQDLLGILVVLHVSHMASLIKKVL